MTLEEHFGSWYDLLKEYLHSDEFTALGNMINQRRQSFNVNVYPSKEDVFKAFRLCDYNNLKVVILGQDPYYTDNMASGLAFGVKDPLGKIPPSLKNIQKEVEADVYDGLKLDFDHSLESWAKQGVLLINTSLTVEENNPGCHIKYWEKFIDYLFNQLAEDKVGIVYICWGNHAKKYIPTFNKHKTNFVLQSAHPSPLSAHNGFFNSKPFSFTNDILSEVAKGIDEDPIKYRIKW